jgi:adenylate cyclase
MVVSAKRHFSGSSGSPFEMADAGGPLCLWQSRTSRPVLRQGGPSRRAAQPILVAYSHAASGIRGRIPSLATRHANRGALSDFGFEKWPAYLNSPVRHVVEQRKLCRWRLDDGEPLPFPVLEEHRSAGYVDYAIAPIIFSDGRVNAVSWATDRPGGFSEADLRLFEEVLPTYSTVVEVKSLRRFAANVLSTYVGHQPGELIMKGQIRRGDVRTIKAALMMVDLRDFTGLSDALPPSKVIETLNRYFDCVIPPIKRHGGEVLEFLGDGILAILNENDERSAREACKLAFEAAREGLDGLSALNHDLSITPRHLEAGFALHYGEVSYGNIGAGDRLDFTVIGPDVNLTSRIERLCRELDRNLIMSEDFVRYLDSPVFEIGHFRLRGFSRMQRLFGLPTA